MRGRGARGSGRAAGGAGSPPKVGGGCRRAGPRATARPMLPAATPLAPIDQRKTRALTTIYAPRKLKPRKNKTAQSRMLDDLPIKPTLSPFHPLPAIGQKVEERPKTKVIVLDLDKNDRSDTIMESRIKFHEVLKPLTPLRIHGYTRKKSLEPLDERKPQQLLRENTYDVIKPIYVNAAKVTKRDRSISRRPVDLDSNGNEKDSDNEVKISPKTRFKKAALQVAKLSSTPETGKLLCLREKQTFNYPQSENDKSVRLEGLPQSPAQKLTKLSEIFQCLEMKGRHRDKMIKENSWF